MERLAIIGPGSMGLLFAYYLAPVFSETILIDEFKDRARLINRSGVKVTAGGKLKKRKVRATTKPAEVGPVELALVCVKSYDTKAAVKSALPLVGKNTLVLTLQNGLGNLEQIAELAPRRQILGGTTAMAANTVKPGQVRFAGAGETIIGQMDGGIEQAERVAEKFRAAGLKAGSTGNLEGALWSKLIINASVNPLTALLRVRNGALLSRGESRFLLAGSIAESAMLAKRKGVRLLYDDPLARLDQVLRSTSNNLSSMLQDVMARRRTEIDAINGALTDEARKLKFFSPFNMLMTLLVRSLERSYDDQIE